jgi:hypothetical protein
MTIASVADIDGVLTVILLKRSAKPHKKLSESKIKCLSYTIDLSVTEPAAAVAQAPPTVVHRNICDCQNGKSSLGSCGVTFTLLAGFGPAY